MSRKQVENTLPAFGMTTLLAFAISTCSFLFLSNETVRADAVDWPTLGFTQIVPNTFNHPTVITHAGDNSQRLFIVEQPGRIWVVQSNSVLASPFLDISDRVLSSGSEQGLLGLTFPPGFSTNNHFYVDYTRKPDGAIVISRFFLTLTNSNIADTNSEQIIKIISKPSPPTTYNNHNAGQLAFGPDGYLYIGVGDGGSEGDPLNNGQKTNALYAKILRIDVESGAVPYAVPTSNPFVTDTNFPPETWAWGLRNPWRFSFDRQTGDLYIGDVGQNRYEEIDFQLAGSTGGQNYGWRIMEGTNNYIVPSGFTNFSALTLPVAWYDHYTLPSDGEGAVIGGYVYRGPNQPRMNGMYFYGDFMAGWIWGMKQADTNWQSQVLINPGPSTSHFMISTFGEDDEGQIYLADYYAGKIYQIQDSLQVWTPTFSPANGTIFSNTVVVASLTTNAEIHYTTNGIDPTVADPFVVSGATISISAGITYKIKAFRSDLTPSAVATAIFNFKVGTPIFTPPTGPITSNALVSISSVTTGAALY
ncbi:MAG: PQQ-dependent sugar dehydrogenase, partial [Limisphaerales bacterium]